MFEKLKMLWTSSHRRIQDFKQKRMMKFPQIYFLNYEVIYDKNRGIWENKSNLISKYTFNLENDTEIDIGGNLFMRDNLGIGNVFSSLRFYAFKNTLFNSITMSFGERKSFMYETNYLFSNNTLVDYIYKRKNILDKSKHKVTLHKLWNNSTKFQAGMTLVDNFEDFSLNFAGKKYISAKYQSIEGVCKLGLTEIKLSGKLKENVIKNFYLTTGHKIVFDVFFPVMHSHNELIYKFYNRFFKFGYFCNFDGVGLELGYRSGGIEINLPIKLFQGEFNLEEESNKSFSSIIFNLFKNILIFTALNYTTKYIAKKIKKYYKSLKADNAQTESLKKNMTELRAYQHKIVQQIRPQSEKNQLKENDRGDYGLIINFAIYGNYQTIKKILNEFSLVEKDRLKDFLDGYIKRFENEIINVSVPVRYLIKRDEKTSISSILFHQIPKTKIVGFINPLLKPDKEPRLMINYSIGGRTYTIVKRDSEVFQIPETLSL